MQLAVESLGRWNRESRSHNSRTKTPFSRRILVYACVAEDLRKRARVVARDDVKPPSNTGYKSMKSTKVQNPRRILPYLAFIMPMRVRGNWARLRTRGLALRARAAAGDQSEATRMRTIYN